MHSKGGDMADRCGDRKKVRSETFSLRVNIAEQQMLEALARKLQRSRSDVVRLLVREALLQLKKSETTAIRGEEATTPEEADGA